MKPSARTTVSTLADADVLPISASDGAGGFLDRALLGDVVKRQFGAAGNVTTTDPGVGDDSADGYRAGSLWLNTTDGGLFVCTDATEGAAVWAELPGTSALTESSTSTFTNKTANSFTNTIEADGVHVEVRNVSGSAIAAGAPVYISGYNVGAEIIEVGLADAGSAATMPALGIAETSIANNTNGPVAVLGRISGIDTSSWNAGDLLYVNGAGVLTTTIPTGADIVQAVAIVLRSHASLGILEVIGSNVVPKADALAYDNTTSGLTATNVQDAIDEIAAFLSI